MDSDEGPLSKKALKIGPLGLAAKLEREGRRACLRD